MYNIRLYFMRIYIAPSRSLLYLEQARVHNSKVPAYYIMDPYQIEDEILSPGLLSP